LPDRARGHGGVCCQDQSDFLSLVAERIRFVAVGVQRSRGAGGTKSPRQAVRGDGLRTQVSRTRTERRPTSVGKRLRVHDCVVDGIQTGALSGVVLRLIDRQRGGVRGRGGPVSPLLTERDAGHLAPRDRANRRLSDPLQDRLEGVGGVQVLGDGGERRRQPGGRCGFNPSLGRLISSTSGGVSFGRQLLTGIPRLLLSGLTIDSLRRCLGSDRRR
jgi:hypothetical protein